jgi:hypothetical protein
MSKLTGAKKNRMSECAIAESGHEKIRKTVREKAGTWVPEAMGDGRVWSRVDSGVNIKIFLLGGLQRLRPSGLTRCGTRRGET